MTNLYKIFQNQINIPQKYYQYRLYMSSKSKESTIYQTFLFLSLFLGSLFSILIPLYQVPDEETHLNELYKYLGEDIKFSQKTEYYGDTLRLIGNYNEKVNIKKYIATNKKLDIICDIKKLDIHIIRYLPQSIGIIISELLNLPIIFSITLSELLAILFYTLVGRKTLKLMPIKKELMMMIILLPICIQQAGSFSYDMMLLSFSFLFIANIFNLKLVKTKITNRDLAKLIAILLIIALIKIPYILLSLLIFILPKEKITLFKKLKNITNTKISKITLIITSLIIVILTTKILININYIKVLLAFLINPIASISLIIRTLIEHFGFYVMSIFGYFGWHDTPVSIKFGIFIIINLLLINFWSDNNYQEKNLSKQDNIYIFLSGIFSCVIIIISLFDWTIIYNGIDTTNFTISDYAKYISNMHDILGIQGRYFVPFLPLLIIPLNLKINNFKNQTILKIFQLIYYLTLTFYMLITIIKRYWF